MFVQPMEKGTRNQDSEHGGDQHHIPGAVGRRQPWDPKAYWGLSQKWGLVGGGSEWCGATPGSHLAGKTVKNTREETTNAWDSKDQRGKISGHRVYSLK